MSQCQTVHGATALPAQGDPALLQALALQQLQSGGNPLVNSASKAIQAMEALDNRRYTDPLSVILEFDAACLREIRPRPGETWTYLQVWEAVDFTRCRTAGRFLYLIMQALQDLREGQILTAHAGLVLAWRAGKQFQIDNQNWTNAFMITGLRDPYGSEDWGGTMTEMAAISQYQKCTRDLKSNAFQGGFRSNLDATDDHSQDASLSKRERKAKAKEKAAALKAERAKAKEKDKVKSGDG